MGIEPTRPAWKAGILPLNYTRILNVSVSIDELYYNIKKNGCQPLFIKKLEIAKLLFLILNINIFYSLYNADYDFCSLFL